MDHLAVQALEARERLRIEPQQAVAGILGGRQKRDGVHGSKACAGDGDRKAGPPSQFAC
jgi:hypothetical protein